MIKRPKAKLMYVPWDASALADALFETQDFAQARVLAKALAMKMVDDTKAEKAPVSYLNANQAEEQAQAKTLTEALMRQWMRPLMEPITGEEPRLRMDA
jgi:hypothetical protein